MILFKPFLNRYVGALRNIQSTCESPLLASNSSNCSGFSFLPSTLHFSKKSEAETRNRVELPLSVFFRQAVGLAEKSESIAVQYKEEIVNDKLKERLRKLEEEVRSLSGENLNLPLNKGKLLNNSVDKPSLWALFADKKIGEVKSLKPTDFGNEDPMVHKELSPDMQMFTRLLYIKGYFKNASFVRQDRFDLTSFEVSYSREFLKFAAVNFGKDHQEIAKWLSASNLKKVALFGCPSLGQRSVYAAKHMRRFFQIEEHKVCQKCRLKNWCKYADKSLRKEVTDLQLASVTRVLTMYALDSVPQQLVVPQEIKLSISRLLKEIINLSQDAS